MMQNKKIPAYGRQRISRPIYLVTPIKKVKKGRGVGIISVVENFCQCEASIWYCVSVDQWGPEKNSLHGDRHPTHIPQTDMSTYIHIPEKIAGYHSEYWYLLKIRFEQHMKRARLESSGWRPISLIGITKGIALFLLGKTNPNFQISFKKSDFLKNFEIFRFFDVFQHC